MVILVNHFKQIDNRINDLESALKQIEQISLEKMKSSEPYVHVADPAWQQVNKIATKALWPV